MYNTEAPDGIFLVNNLGEEVEAGPAFTQAAIEAVIPGFEAGFVAIKLLFLLLQRLWHITSLQKPMWPI